jgi:hypothetical protein
VRFSDAFFALTASYCLPTKPKEALIASANRLRNQQKETTLKSANVSWTNI